MILEKMCIRVCIAFLRILCFTSPLDLRMEGLYMIKTRAMVVLEDPKKHLLYEEAN